MVMLRNIYTGENICAFDNETDAFETLMSLIEERAYSAFQLHYLCYGYDLEASYEYAVNEADDFIEGLYFQEFPYLEGNFPHLKESE